MNKKTKLERLRTEAIQERLESNYKIADRAMVFLALFVSVYAFIVGFYKGIMIEAVLAVVVVVVPFLGNLFLIKNRMIKNRLTGTFFILLVAVVIGSSRGIVEARYWYFIAIGLLVIYQSIPMIIWGGMVAVIFNVYVFPATLLDLPGHDIVDQFFLEPSNQSWEKFVYTLFWVLVSIFTNSIVASRLRKRFVQSVTLQFDQQQQIETYLENKKIADEIANGNLDDIVINAGDDLGRSLRNILLNLRENDKKEQAEKFVTEGLSVVNQIFREEDLQVAFQKALVYVGDHVNAQAGLIVTLASGQENLTLAEKQMELRAHFSCQVDAIENEGILIGDGMLGQACIQKKLMVLDEVPDEYMPINSGLGGHKPKYLIMVPIIFDDEVLGGLELAAFEEVTDEKTQFLSQASSVIGSAILRYLIGVENDLILHNAQERTTEFEQKEQEFNLKIAELEEQIRAYKRGEAPEEDTPAE